MTDKAMTHDEALKCLEEVDSWLAGKLRAAHAREVAEAKVAALEAMVKMDKSDEIIECPEIRDTLRALVEAYERQGIRKGRAEAFRRAQGWIRGRTLGYPHGDAADMLEWLEQRAAEEESK